ncbi:MAG: chemotaxis protein CheR [Oceanospirillaceae bacterium]|nr:chemotaxis protein CheR [Oceanospirillaceae bacterium]|tara:strand:- start:5341 stop:5955 length:615 start_codon:yes stop_codon:yes gene_type:complete
MLDKIIHDFLIIWATIDPIGTMALFAGLTAKLSDHERRRTALKTFGYATAVLLGAIVIGQIILTAMGIRMISFQLAGGIILFLFGLQMIFSRGGQEESTESSHDMAVFPLAIPTTATPGAILAVIVLTDNSVHPITEQIGTALVMMLVLVITLGLMLLSGRILQVIGTAGASILTRLMGMILAALSVELIMEALGVAKWIGNLN